VLATGGVLTDPRALGDAQTGEFDRRFAAVRPKLLAICSGLVGTDAAEDVVQDSYLRGRSRFAQLRETEAFEAWIVRIAVNLGHTHERRRRGLISRLPSLFRSQRGPVTPDLGLRELIERLPTRERTVLVLHYAHGYRLEEIGRLLGLSSTNVRTIIFRARRRIAEQWPEAPT